mmetsp:Transcript_17331/g.23802  ORF Transcript_17331/g.23802 Transcript_17331/m.23802 type:complete len:433 (-) Transcript_17331:277-1575(-)
MHNELAKDRQSHSWCEHARGRFAISDGGQGSCLREEEEEARHDQADGGHLGVALLQAAQVQRTHHEGRHQAVECQYLIHLNSSNQCAAALADHRQHGIHGSAATREGRGDGGITQLHHRGVLLLLLQLLHRPGHAVPSRPFAALLAAPRALDASLQLGVVHDGHAHMRGLEGAHVVGAVSAHESHQAGPVQCQQDGLLLRRGHPGEHGQQRGQRAQQQVEALSAARAVLLQFRQSRPGGAQAVFLGQDSQGLGVPGLVRGLRQGAVPVHLAAAPQHPSFAGPGVQDQHGGPGGGRGLGGGLHDAQLASHLRRRVDAISGDHDHRQPGRLELLHHALGVRLQVAVEHQEAAEAQLALHQAAGDGLARAGGMQPLEPHGQHSLAAGHVVEGRGRVVVRQPGRVHEGQQHLGGALHQAPQAAVRPPHHHGHPLQG